MILVNECVASQQIDLAGSKLPGFERQSTIFSFFLRTLVTKRLPPILGFESEPTSC